MDEDGTCRWYASQDASIRLIAFSCSLLVIGIVMMFSDIDPVGRGAFVRSDHARYTVSAVCLIGSVRVCVVAVWWLRHRRPVIEITSRHVRIASPLRTVEWSLRQVRSVGIHPTKGLLLDIDGSKRRLLVELDGSRWTEVHDCLQCRLVEFRGTR